MRRGFVGLRRVCVAGALAGVGVLASCSSPSASGTKAGSNEPTVANASQPCHGKVFNAGNPTGTPSTTVQVVAVLKPSDSADKASAISEELGLLYASCVDSVAVTDSGGPVVFAIDASTTSDQVSFLERQIQATGQFQSVSQRHP